MTKETRYKNLVSQTQVLDWYRRIFFKLLAHPLSKKLERIHLDFVNVCLMLKYDEQDRQGKAALNERSPHPTQQQAPSVRSPGGPQRKTGQGTRQSTGRQIISN
jgi:hypothetical protein